MAKKKMVPNPRPDRERRVRQADRLGRVLRVLQLISGRGRWNANELAAEIGCAERTVYRDLQALEMAGVPYFFDEVENCYRIRPGWYFPAINLTSEEIVGQAIATSIAKSPGLNVSEGAGSTSDRLAARASSVRERRLFEEAEQLVSVFDLKLADHSAHLEMIKTIQWALLNGKQVTGQYVSPYQATPVKLTLHPQRICLIQQAWYLIARPTDKGASRTYRVHRFKTLRMLDTPAEVPDEFDLKAYFGNAWAVYRGDKSYDVEIEFTRDAANLVTETTWHSTQEAKKNSDGTVTLRFTVDGLDEIVWWVLGWSGRAKVVQPLELREMVTERLRVALKMNQE